jgi:hypothetical protein
LTTSGPTTALTVGVVIARDKIDHPWQEFRWRPIELLIGMPDLARGKVLSESATQTTFYGGDCEIELHRKETSGYLVNLENDVPVVYVVLRRTIDDEGGLEIDEHDEPAGDAADSGSELPYVVANVTVSPFHAQDYLDSGEDIVEPLPMSEPLLAWLERFIAEHHEEETFIKRKRDRVNIKNEKFGQEPLEVIRRRQRQH